MWGYIAATHTALTALLTVETDAALRFAKPCFGPCFLQMECCGWTDRQDWDGNPIITNSSMLLFPCSCQNISVATGNVSDSGFCEAQTADWPVYDTVNDFFSGF